MAYFEAQEQFCCANGNKVMYKKVAIKFKKRKILNKNLKIKKYKLKKKILNIKYLKTLLEKFYICM